MTALPKPASCTSCRAHSLSDAQMLALLKAGPTLERIEEAVRDLKTVQASVSLQSVAADWQAQQPGAKPVDRARAQAAMNALHKEYMHTGVTPDLSALEELMREMGLKSPARHPVSQPQKTDVMQNALIGGVSGAMVGTIDSRQTLFRTVTMTTVGVVTALVGLRAMQSIADSFRSSMRER